MVTASRRCRLFGLLWWTLFICYTDGLIEIVEEQQCHDHEFRLTCRDLDTHIAILEAWYTSAQHMQLLRQNLSRPIELKLKTENDSELNKVYVYSSPRHNGVYEPSNFTNYYNYSNHSSFSNSSIFENVTSEMTDEQIENLLNETVDMSVEVLNGSEGCGASTFSRSYASWREGDKRRRAPDWSASINLRAPISYRCTGVNHCSFILLKDYPPAVSWNAGVVYIKYACFDDTVSLHYCNREVRIAASGPDSEGYIRTPGYPHFYVGDECRWRLRAHPEQKVRITMLDVSLRSIGPFENHCTDYVTVQDSSGATLFSSCDQVDVPLKLTSTTEDSEVLVRARSEGAYPKRGVLLHYKSIGCITLEAPSEGYLVYRNEDVAHYMCNVNFVFVDTRQRARFIWCYDDNRWNDTVPLCVEEAASPAVRDDAKLPPNENNMIVDIVIPSLLIAALFIGNAFIVLIIYKYRKRKTDDLEDEFNTIPLSVNGNAHTAGNAV